MMRLHENVGDLDARVRLGAGVVLLVAGILDVYNFRGAVAFASAAFALALACYLVGTAGARVCLLYRLASVDTRRATDVVPKP